MPTVGPEEVLVRVHAVGINRADLAQVRRALASAEETRANCVILGRELAGEVISVGQSVSGMQAGDRVMGMTEGAMASHVAIDHRLLFRIPQGWSWATSAAFPVRSMTAHDALVSNGRMTPGESVLVTGASSVVGATAVQLAPMLGAGETVAVVRHRRHDEILLSLGADRVIAIDDAGHDRQGVASLLYGVAPAVVIDLAGGSLVDPIINCLQVKGRVISVGRLAGNEARVNLGQLARRRGAIIGVSFTSRDLGERSSVASRMWRDFAENSIAERLARFPIRSFPFVEINEALRHLETRSSIEKVVLEVREA